MTFSKIGRIAMALVASAAIGLGMTACGGGTIGYMWVLGSSNSNPPSGEITGFKIDDYTGNLTAIDHSPFSSNGSNPVMLVVKPGGRYIYVINAGTGQVGSPGQTGYVPATATSIAEFSVGGGGELTFQNSYSGQGSDPIYASLDSTGNFLYVLDRYAKNYNGTTDLNGSITAFSIASDTGRLTLVTNTAVLNNGVPTADFEVGPNPIMSRVSSSNCLFTLSSTEVFAYIISSATGQLTVSTTGPQVLGNAGTNFTSINTSAGTSAGSYVFLTDGGLNQIDSYSSSSTSCVLQPVAGSNSTNVQVNAIPVNSVTSNNGKFLYVINNIIPSTTGTAGSSISAFTITNGQLEPLSDPTSNPYAVGSGPVCIVEDPSNQYLYSSNNTDSTVTGKLLNQNTGFLADLTHGSTFPTAMHPTCLAVSGNI
jgi:6-phosphogluconolactonase